MKIKCNRCGYETTVDRNHNAQSDLMVREVGGTHVCDRFEYGIFKEVKEKEEDTPYTPLFDPMQGTYDPISGSLPFSASDNTPDPTPEPPPFDFGGGGGFDGGGAGRDF
jgi:hypothetical protein